MRVRLLKSFLNINTKTVVTVDDSGKLDNEENSVGVRSGDVSRFLKVGCGEMDKRDNLPQSRILLPRYSSSAQTSSAALLVSQGNCANLVPTLSIVGDGGARKSTLGNEAQNRSTLAD
jgi:hypothetical protein